MRNKSYLKEQNILFLLSQNNFIIPEIQREYVWGNNPKVLLNFIGNIKTKASVGCSSCSTPTNKFKINIGFLYTYKPDYVTIDNGRFLDENLIDGQQRFTTLFLLLFFLCLKEIRKDDFFNLIRYEKLISMAFDYKVRNLTHRFLLELVQKCDSVEDLIDVEGHTWFLNEYKKDPSIKSIIKAITIISAFFKDDKTIYFDYILNYVKFWHFKTEATSQGEELYITMNARGEALSKNEETKASIMVADDQQNKWGKKWEDWQDFFWKHRKPNLNADKGFDEFLRWVQVIEMTENSFVDSDDDDENKENVKDIVRLIQADEILLDTRYLSLETIEKYFLAVEYIFKDFQNNLKQLSKFYDIEMDLLPLQLLHPEKGHIEQLECLRLLPSILYCKKLRDDGKNINSQYFFRLVRFLYTLKEDATIRKTVNKQVINALKMVTQLTLISEDLADITTIEKKNLSKSILNVENVKKLEIFKHAKVRIDTELAIWKCEDYKINSGKIGHIIQASYCDTITINNFIFRNNFDNVDTKNFNLKLFKNLSGKFFTITEGSSKLTNNVWSLLLVSEFFSKGVYSAHHDLVLCTSSIEENVIQHKSFLKHLFLIFDNETVADYSNKINKEFFKQYLTVADLQNEHDYVKQIFVYQLAERKSGGNWNWDLGKNFGVFNRNKDTNYVCFFNHKFDFQHYKQRWIGAEYNFINQSKRNIDNYLKINNVFP